MLQNAYFLAKIGADTAENEQHLAEICQKLATTLTRLGHRAAGAERRGGADARAVARSLPAGPAQCTPRGSSEAR